MLSGTEGLMFSWHIWSKVTVQCSPIDLNNVDKLASNGVLHEISRVMLPPAGTVVDAIAACPVFQDLKLAVGVAGLDAALRGKHHSERQTSRRFYSSDTLIADWSD